MTNENTTRRMTAARIIGFLLCPLIAIAVRPGWGGKWLFAPLLACGVFSVMMARYERQLQRLDEPTTLNLHR